MATQIITVEDFLTYKSNTSKKVDEPKIREAIELATQVDLFDVLGEFLFDVMDNRANPEYNDLMVGCKFTVDNKSFSHDGLKSLIADYAYARYTVLINSHFTPFGLQQKFTQDSQSVDRNMIRDIVKQSQIDTSIKFRFIDKYLLSKPNLFSRYKCGTNDKFINTFGNKLTTLF